VDARPIDHARARRQVRYDERLGIWRHRAVVIFLAVVVLHWSEHLVQAYQVWVLDWPREDALGGLGVIWPWLAQAEVLHVAYNLFVLFGLMLLLPIFRGVGRTFWLWTTALQMWHFFEHGLLQAQVLLAKNLLGADVPTSMVQLFVPRVELHLFYNGVVTVPIAIAVWLRFWWESGPRRGKWSDGSSARESYLTTQLGG
jgi:hypothetical protein